MPHCGRDSSSRVSTTSEAYVRVSPASTGFSHFRSRNPGDGPDVDRLFAARNHLRGLALNRRNGQLHIDRRDMPTRCGETSKHRVASCFLVKMKWLWVELQQQMS